VLSLLDVTERVRAESQRDATLEVLQERTKELGERVKELNCLYGISALVEKPGVSLAEILQRTVELIPPGWQYPEITGARVALEGDEFRTVHFSESAAWQQSADIIVHGQPSGSVEVCYLEERPESDEGPFLMEERSLINAIAERLGEIIKRVRAEALLREQNQFITTVFESLRHPFYVVDANDYSIKMANSAVLDGELPPGVTCFALTHGRTTPCAEAGHSCPVEEIKKTGKPVVMEHTHYDQEGDRRVYEVRGHPIFDDAGEVAQIIEYTLDVTERKQMEEALRTARDELELRVQERTAALATANQALRTEIADREEAEETLRESEERYRRLVELAFEGVAIPGGTRFRRRRYPQSGEGGLREPAGRKTYGRGQPRGLYWQTDTRFCPSRLLGRGTGASAAGGRGRRGCASGRGKADPARRDQDCLPGPASRAICHPRYQPAQAGRGGARARTGAHRPQSA
jgi:PAS domain-containing protein